MTSVNSVNKANFVSLGKLIIRNVRKNIQDYMIYFLTLTVSVSMFYAFNSIQTQPALNDLDATKQLLSDQLGHLPMIFDAKWQNFCVRKIPMPMPVQAQGS